ncbi:DUF2085 domain-containing protein [Bacillus tianshenii]|nr:DUF2085 domain-containing protein [Bacillus tianshenii]
MKTLVQEIMTLQFIPCHRKRERSLVVCGRQFPICFRCMAILLGYLFVIPLLFFVEADQIILKLGIALLCHVPMFADGFTQLWGWRSSRNGLRFCTGLLSGFGQSLLIVVIAKWLVELII